MYAQVGVYLGGLLIRREGQEDDGPPVMTVGDPLMPDERPMAGIDNQTPLEEQRALIRTGVRRVVTAFLASPGFPLRVTGEIAGSQSWNKTWYARRGSERTGWRPRCGGDHVSPAWALATAGALVRHCPMQVCGKVFVRRDRPECGSTASRTRTNVRKWYQRTRKETKATLMMPHARRRKRRSMYLWRARARGKPKQRAKHA